MNKMRKKLSMVVLGVVLVMALSVTAFASSAWDSFNGELYDMPAAEAGKCNELPILQRF